MFLAPFYDLISTMVYPELDKKFAMSIGNTFRFDRIKEHSWKQFAMDVNIRVERLYSLMEAIHKPILSALDSLLARHEQLYGRSSVYETLSGIVMNGLNRIAVIIDSGNKN